MDAIYVLYFVFNLLTALPTLHLVKHMHNLSKTSDRHQIGGLLLVYFLLLMIAACTNR